ncbi:carbohydrate esterase family 5 protein [Pleomassaria siparia CBS 279.74]|uniref:Cutinase n=1 Tax=Pleomassaria siparia CBS 279.74 TaxID=1314801 RepID=A0A6G1KCJ1_9PLEO|nr:carbohydrate esterase family 5 protein [Pleomassaria siparia CBS 279.74]
MKASTATFLLTPFLAYAAPASDTTLGRLPLADISLRSAESFSRLAVASRNFDPSKTPRAAAAANSSLSATSQNDIKNGVCKPMTILFARGTTEQGNVGSLTGPPFFQAVAASMGGASLAIQGVDYPADIPGFLAGGDAAGSKSMAATVGQIMTACPSTNLVISGYSQGGQLVHNAAAMLTPAQTAFVKSAVIFGDPNDGKPVGNVSAADTLIVCHMGDLICAGTAMVRPPHLNYSGDAVTAAAFVLANMGAAGKAAVKAMVAQEAADAVLNGTERAAAIAAAQNGAKMNRTVHVSSPSYASQPFSHHRHT